MLDPQPISAIPPPAGHISNFTNPVSLWRWNVLCVTVCLSIVTLFFTLRVYVRLVIKRQWTFEDYICSLSWVAFVTYCGLMTTLMSKHGGVHEWDLTQSQVHTALYWFNITSVEYGPAILLTKLSVLLLYRRVFLPNLWSVFDIIIRLLILILCLFYLAITLVKIWECTPRARIWDKSVGGTCVDIPSLLNASGLFNTITDVLILLIPVKSVWNLNMKKRRKIEIVVIFTVGSIAPVFSLIGFIVRLQVSSSRDMTYYQPEILLWATAEISTGIICVCLPTLAAFTRRRSRGPSASIVNGDSNMRHKISSSGQQHLGLNDQSLLDGEYLELGAGNTQDVDLGINLGVVTTEVRGGVMSPTVQSGGFEVAGIAPIGGENLLDQSAQEMSILKTVKIEQAHVRA